MISGVVQAFATRMPKVSYGISLDAALEACVRANIKIALDNYEAQVALGAVELKGESVVLALGSERGWTAKERGLLRDRQFLLAHLGPRPLRTETATIAGIALLLRRMV